MSTGAAASDGMEDKVTDRKEKLKHYKTPARRCEFYPEECLRVSHQGMRVSDGGGAGEGRVFRS